MTEPDQNNDNLPICPSGKRTVIRVAETPEENELALLQQFLARCDAYSDWERFDNDLLVELMTEPALPDEYTPLEKELIVRLMSYQTQLESGELRFADD